MLISVDLPAPFSPMMPWIEPFSTRMAMSLLAWTGPKCLLIPTSSMAGGVPVPTAADGAATAGPTELSVMPLAG